MLCLQCWFEFDEMNESQPVSIGIPEDTEVVEDDGSGPIVDTGKLPIDLQQAADDAAALLEATGLAVFRLPDGAFRLFRVPTGRVM